MLQSHSNRLFNGQTDQGSDKWYNRSCYEIACAKLLETLFPVTLMRQGERRLISVKLNFPDYHT